jgi:hypothetical protein
MAKKKGGKSKGNVSAGIHSNVSSAIRSQLRADYLASPQRVINQRRAFDEGKRVMVTIENPNREETNRPFIRVEAKQAGWKTRK